jgi:hypothetical protein
MLQLGPAANSSHRQATHQSCPGRGSDQRSPAREAVATPNGGDRFVPSADLASAQHLCCPCPQQIQVRLRRHSATAEVRRGLLHGKCRHPSSSAISPATSGSTPLARVRNSSIEAGRASTSSSITGPNTPKPARRVVTTTWPDIPAGKGKLGTHGRTASTLLALSKINNQPLSCRRASCTRTCSSSSSRGWLQTQFSRKLRVRVRNGRGLP